MRIELECSQCHARFPVRADVTSCAALERLAEEGPWAALGDGETWEDRVHACLTDAASSSCCGAPAAVSEESLVELSQELLAQW
jgi:hypothetical protein